MNNSNQLVSSKLSPDPLFENPFFLKGFMFLNLFFCSPHGGEHEFNKIIPPLPQSRGEGVILRIVYPFIASYLFDCVRLRELLEVIVEVMLGDIEVMHKSLEDVWSIDMVLIPKLYS